MIRAAIYVRGAWAELRNAPENTLESCLAFAHPSPWYSAAYREKRWDGKVRLFERATNRFPAGLVQRVVAHLHDLEREVFVSGFDDKTPIDLSALERDWLPGIELWDHQWDAVNALLKHKRGVVKSPTGCHRRGQRVVRYDGSLVAVEDVRVGDVLLGPDSTPRKVLELCRGVGAMFEVRPVRGEPFVVNGDHVLSLVRTNASKALKNRVRRRYSSCLDGTVVNVTVRAWLGWSKWRRHVYKMRSSDLVTFGKVSALPVDPYFLGVWLGDGTKSLVGIEITKPDTEIEECVREEAARWSLKVVDHAPRCDCPVWAIVGVQGRPNPLLDALRALFEEHGVCVPDRYRTASLKDRRALLAGLLDTDGHLSNGCFDFVQKSAAIFEGVLFIARSLGLRASEGKTKVVNGVRYRRMTISGNLEDVPTRILRKQAEPRRQVKNHRRRGFQVAQVADSEDFYGFRLDGDHLYLLDDFTVTHNSGKSEDIFTAASFLWDAKQWRSLIIVPKKGLLRQTYARACEYFDDWITVGMAGDGVRIEGNIVVATGQTMQRWRATRTKKRGMVPADPWLRELVKTYEVLFLDECHRASSAMWYDIAMNSGAQRRYGFSGTPIKDSEIDDMRLIGATGPIVFDVGAPELVEAGLAAKPKILMVMSSAVSGSDITEDVRDEAEREKERNAKKRAKKKLRTSPEPNKYRIAYRLGVMCNETHNAAVVRAAQWMIAHDRKTLLMCRYKEHFDILAQLLEESDTNYVGVWGKSDNSDRDHAKKALGNGTVKLVLATGIWDEGEDIPGVNGLVFAEGVKANTNSRQRVGRGMRGDTEDVWVVDFVPTCHDTLREHAAKRAEAWEGEGYEVLVWTDWPKHADDALDLPFGRWDEELSVES